MHGYFFIKPNLLSNWQIYCLSGTSTSLCSLTRVSAPWRVELQRVPASSSLVLQQFFTKNCLLHLPPLTCSPLRQHWHSITTVVITRTHLSCIVFLSSLYHISADAAIDICDADPAGCTRQEIGFGRHSFALFHPLKVACAATHSLSLQLDLKYRPFIVASAA